MHRNPTSRPAAAVAARQNSLYRILLFTGLGTIILALIIAASSFAQPANSTGSFFKNITGEWIGVCEQSTNGQQAPDKFFHASIKQVSGSNYTGLFKYYRADEKTGSPIPIGQSTMSMTIQPDGSVASNITGSGVVLVDNKPKNQSHQLQEALKPGVNGLEGKSTGKVSVSGMPLGLGKNGKILDGKSVWTISNGVLNINQALKVGFKALIVNKKFTMDAHYTATHGTDIAKLILQRTRLASARSAVAETR